MHNSRVETEPPSVLRRVSRVLCPPWWTRETDKKDTFAVSTVGLGCRRPARSPLSLTRRTGRAFGRRPGAGRCVWASQGSARRLLHHHVTQAQSRPHAAMPSPHATAPAPRLPGRRLAFNSLSLLTHHAHVRG